MSQHKWAHHFIKPEDLKQVHMAVTTAEKTTSGEIVPMIVRRSSAIGTLPALIATTLLTIALLANTFLISKPLIIPVMIAVFLLIMIAAHFLALCSCIQKWFLPKHDQQMQVHQRAFAEFCHHHIDRTQNHTGILIFVSLMERQVVVLADKGIASKLPQETWNEVIQLILANIKKGKPCDGLIAGIKRCGEILEKHFPHSSSNKSELSNRLIIKE